MFLAIFLLNFARVVSSYCDNYLTYVNDGKETYGRIEIPFPDSSKSSVKVVFNVIGELKPNPNFFNKIFYGDLSVINIDKTDSDITKLPLIVKLRFPIQNPVPKVQEIQYNSKPLCSESFEDEKNSQPITLVYDLTRFVPNRFNSEIPKTTSSLQRPKTTSSASTTTTTRSTTSKLNNMNLEAICGESLIGTRINLGSDADPGQFPWLVAYFYLENINSESEFVCGGSLISRKLIITAAHCIESKGNSSSTKLPKNSLFFIGINDLNLKKKSNPMIATEFHVNLNWDPTDVRYDSDIAIVVLSKTVLFNEIVKPICIWSRTNNYEDMIDKIGTVAGWGLTESGTESFSTAKYVEIPVIKDGICYIKDPRLTIFSSENTFCAGKEKIHNGPCKGDSGSGFIYKENYKSYLRGIVSVGIWSFERKNCDLTFFTVFTDVSKFTQWIQSFIKKFG